MGIAALGLDVGAQSHEAVGAAAGQHHGRTGLGQGFGELFAQAAGGPGDEGHTAGQIDLVGHGIISGMVQISTIVRFSGAAA